MCSVLIGHSGSEFPEAGMNGDERFLVGMIATFQTHNWSADYFNKGLSSAYPFYYHFLASKIGNLFGWTSWYIWKICSEFNVFVFPVLSYFFWRKITNSVVAFAISFASVMSFHRMIRDPQETIALLVVPWFVYYFLSPSWNKRHTIIGGAIGGFLFGTYYFWFFPLIPISIYLLIDQRFFSSVEKRMAYYLKIFSVFLVVILPYAGPYLLDIIKYGVDPYNVFWMPERDYSFLGGNTIQHMVTSIGILWALISKKEDSLGFKLRNIFISAVVSLIVMGIFTIHNKPMFPSKMLEFIQYLSVISFVDLAYVLLKKYVRRDQARKVMRYAAFIFVIFPSALNLANKRSSEKIYYGPGPLVKNASFAEKTKDKVLLACFANQAYHASYLPARYFVGYTILIAHPSSQTPERLAFLHILSFSKDSKFVAWVFRNNKFQPIDYVWPGWRFLDFGEHDFKGGMGRLSRIRFDNKTLISNLIQDKEFSDLYAVPDVEFSVESVKKDSIEYFILSRFTKVFGKKHSLPDVVQVDGGYILSSSECDKKPYIQTIVTKNTKNEDVDLSEYFYLGHRKCLGFISNEEIAKKNLSFSSDSKISVI